MSQLSLPGREHEIAGGKPEEGHDSSLADPLPCVVFDPKQESRLWRKVDLRLMPMIALMYLLSFMDRGVASVIGIDLLDLTGNQYNTVLTVFFISFAIFESPCNVIIQFVSPSKWLAGIMILWGIVMYVKPSYYSVNSPTSVKDAFGFCKDISSIGCWATLSRDRRNLTMWYPKYMLQCRFAIFLGAATSSGAFSGLLAYGINFMDGIGGLRGWSWIFILEGLVTVLVGFIAIFGMIIVPREWNSLENSNIVMVDYPSSAKFLTPEEKQFIIQRREFSQVDDGGDIGAQIRGAFMDWQIWALSLIQISALVPLYGITYFLPTIINDFGYSTSTSQLLTVPPYVLAVIVLGVFAYYSDKKKLRSPFIFTAQLIALIGFIINITDASSGVKYFGTFWCVAGSYTAGTGPVIWAANNLEGKYKRAVGMALVITMGTFGGAIASNIFRAQDAPRYLLGFGIEIMFMVMGMLVIPIVALAYVRLNTRKDELEIQMETSGFRSRAEASNEEKFRYTL
ncbi:hypothetical protein SCLCIDRAFT_28656 [Scleroderma citrinum Foug A]|uniref:Major facilitator superfamily (MFS) profile domain-containing protein n=1 Tax=Scleroderma citrinum Foug A TaxID=1036808 RepID=A0A0C3DN94_9AGAM|nr:hypothetical protein SCLCIDRAFT_28656 [Scleroderma citrinum Foug A]